MIADIVSFIIIINITKIIKIYFIQNKNIIRINIITVQNIMQTASCVCFI